MGVVFGKDTSVTGDFAVSIDLETLDGSNGFKLTGIDTGDHSGNLVSSAGDVNGDGIDDILIGARFADPNGVSGAGETYVVFGKDTAETSDFAASIDLETLDGSDGFVLNGIDSFDYSGLSVSSAGDVNGDGIGDILIGAHAADPNGVTHAGETYVVFGKDTAVTGDFAASIDLETLDGSDGFVLNGIDPSDYSGVSVSSAGDVNGDGIDDILIGAPSIGAPGAYPDSTAYSGETYVVFGKNTAAAGSFAASFDLETLDGSDGFVLNGVHSHDQNGFSVATAGDVNGDGIDDILIGAYAADPNGVGAAGEAYIVFGKDTTATESFAASVDLETLDGNDGFVFKGVFPHDQTGYSVASAGDVNGDGVDDILIGAPGVDRDVIDVGGTYVVFGGAGLLETYDAADGVSDGAIDLALIGQDPDTFFIG